MVTTDVFLLIDDFLNFKKFKENNNYVGTIFYGSYSNNLQNINSDIDLIIVFDKLDKQTKCYELYKGIVFEYYERSLDSLYERIEHDIRNYNDSSLSIIGYGKIIGGDKYLKKLQQYTRNKFKKDWPRLMTNAELRYRLVNLHKNQNYLKRLYDDNDPYFNIFYAIVLDKIRLFYHETKGFSKIGTSKVFKIYSNKVIAKKQKRILPDDSFIDLFKRCVLTSDKEEKMVVIMNLYYSVIKSYKIDFNKVKINLNGREY